MKQKIGYIKAKKTVYCSICKCKYTRVLNAPIYENTEEEVKKAKEELTEKTNKKYTCKICKSMS